MDAYALGMGKLHALGGLAVVSAHTQILDSDNRRRALLSAAEFARGQEGWWVAEGSEVASWWRARSLAQVVPVQDPGPDRAGDGGGDVGGARGEGVPGQTATAGELDVEGAGKVAVPPTEVAFAVAASDEGLTGGWLELFLPGMEGRVPLLDDAPVAYEKTPWGVRVPLGTLEPQGRSEVRMVPAPTPGVAASGPR